MHNQVCWKRRLVLARSSPPAHARRQQLLQPQQAAEKPTWSVYWGTSQMEPGTAAAAASRLKFLWMKLSHQGVITESCRGRAAGGISEWDGWVRRAGDVSEGGHVRCPLQPPPDEKPMVRAQRRVQCAALLCCAARPAQHAQCRLEPGSTHAHPQRRNRFRVRARTSMLRENMPMLFSKKLMWVAT